MQAEDILIANKAISDLKKSVNHLFLGECSRQSFRLPSTLLTKDASESISVEMPDLNIVATAKAWPVRVGDNWQWRLEYVFLVVIEDVKHEVARIYFNDDGYFEKADQELLTASHNVDSVCDAVCSYVYSGALTSTLFSPRPML